MYEISDPKTHSTLEISVIADNKGVRFDMQCKGTFLVEGMLKCADIIKELCNKDCFGLEVKEGEEKDLSKTQHRNLMDQKEKQLKDLEEKFIRAKKIPPS